MFHLFQAYFLGCTFDSFSTSWQDRSYVVILLIIAWLIPMLLIVRSHINILYLIKNSDVNIVLVSSTNSKASTSHASSEDKREAVEMESSQGGNNLPHVNQKVCRYNTERCIVLFSSILSLFAKIKQFFSTSRLKRKENLQRRCVSCCSCGS